MKLFEQRLDEGKKQIDDMLAPITKLMDELCADGNLRTSDDMDYGPSLRTAMHGHVSQIAAFAKKLRKDQAQWFVRLARIKALNALCDDSSVAFQRTGGEGLEAEERLRALAEKWHTQLAKQMGINPNELHTSSTIGTTIVRIEHFLGIPYQPIQNYTWVNQSPDQLFKDLKELEEAFKEKSKGLATMHEGDKVLLTFPGKDDEPDYMWVMLNRAACDEEANAMGHCGNSPRRTTDDRIISLRSVDAEIEGTQFYRPCLTFILHGDGYLGEMKGRGNQKPAEHYHRQIEALLHLDIIKGIKGGGYMPENNFAIRDLDGDSHRALVSKKPALASFYDRIKVFGVTKDLTDQMMHDVIDNRKDPRRAIQEKMESERAAGQMRDVTQKEAVEILNQLKEAEPFFSPNIKEGYESLEFKRFIDFVRAIFDSITRVRDNYGSTESNYLDERHQLFMYLTHDELLELHKAIPDIAGEKELYLLYGMTDDLMSRLSEALTEDFNIWFDYSTKGTTGFYPHDIKREDLRKLFAAYPKTNNTMLSRILNDGAVEHAEELLDSVREGGLNNTRENLYWDHAEAPFVREVEAACPAMMEAKKLVEFMNGNEDGQLTFDFAVDRDGLWEQFLARVDATFTTDDAGYGACAMAPQWDDELKKFAGITLSTHDLIEEYCDEAENYWPPHEKLEFYSNGTDYAEAAGKLPLWMQYEIRKIAVEEYEIADDIDEIDIAEAVEALEENGDEHDILSALSNGEERIMQQGAISEAEDAFESAVKHAGFEYGHLIFRLGTDYDEQRKEPKKYGPIIWPQEKGNDEKVYLTREDCYATHVMSIDEMAEFIEAAEREGGIEGEGESLHPFGKWNEWELKLEVPSYGWHGYLESSEESDIMSEVMGEYVSHEAFDKIGSWPHARADIKKMSDKEATKLCDEFEPEFKKVGGSLPVWDRARYSTPQGKLEFMYSKYF